ncbi:cold-shock protein [Propionibacterium sp.]|uniref:cold-shock protein n=1 Tax=Propionibacterium sp. TaxID=1977903 RepID=UPI0039E8F2DE
MPSGRVRFFDAEKGFGFITKDEGEGEVYFRASVLPAGVATVKRGQRVEFGIIEGRRGEQALSLQLIEPPPSLSKATRRKPEDLAVMMEDLIKLLDGLSNGYRHGRHPSSTQATKIATMLRGVADELEK